MNSFVFMSGLPRTGSTVLGTLLSQHPELHTTSTSIIGSMMWVVADQRLGQNLYFDRSDDNSPLWGILRGMLNGAYENCDGKTVIDKNRSWPKHIDLIEKTLRTRPKIIATVRSLPDILSSFTLIANKIGPNSKILTEITQSKREINPWSLTRVLWEKYIYETWRDFKSGYENFPDCFHLIEYDDLVSDPQKTLKKTYEFIGVDPIQTQTGDLSNPNPEKDSVYGLPGLHFVRPDLKRTSPPAIEVLGESCHNFWKKQELEFWQGKT